MNGISILILDILRQTKRIVLFLTVHLVLCHLNGITDSILLIWGYRVDIDDIVRLVLLGAFNTDILHFDLKLRPTNAQNMLIKHLVGPFL